MVLYLTDCLPLLVKDIHRILQWVYMSCLFFCSCCGDAGNPLHTAFLYLNLDGLCIQSTASHPQSLSDDLMASQQNGPDSCLCLVVFYCLVVCYLSVFSDVWSV